VKGKKEKISVMFLFLILLGANVANLQLISSVVPKHNWREPTEQVFEKKVSRNDAHELDYQTLVEVSEFILAAAEKNNYQFDCVVYSAALLFESEDALIIIGHGYFDSKQQYFIGDYSERAIQKMAHGRDIVALLACYSATIVLANKKQLTYQNSIDLLTAIKDLGNNLAWVQKSIFTPSQNILLFDLESGGGGAIEDATIPWNGLRFARTGYDNGKIWNLWYDNAQILLKNFMLANQGIEVEFTLTGSYLIEIATGTYQWYYHVLTYDAWLYMNSDDNIYLHIENIVKNDEKEKRIVDVKYKELSSLYTTQGYTPFITMTVLLCTLLCEIGLALLAPLGSALIKGGAITGLIKVAAIIGVVFIVLAIITAIAVWIITITWI